MTVIGAVMQWSPWNNLVCADCRLDPK